MKIALSGTHGSGKTTLAYNLVAKLKILGNDVVYMPEVARDSPYLIAGKKIPETDFHLFCAQAEAELRYSMKSNILVTDRSVFDRIAYAKIFFPESPYIKAMEEFGKHYAFTYDFIFRTSKTYDTNKIEDNLRPKGDDLQIKTHETITDVLEKYYPKYITLDHNKSNYVDFIIDIIKK